MGLYPFLISRFFVYDPTPVSGELGVRIIIPLPAKARAALAVAFDIIQIVHVYDAAAILDGVSDSLGDDDRSSIGLLVSSSADGKNSAAKQFVLPAHVFPPFVCVAGCSK